MGIAYEGMCSALEETIVVGVQDDSELVWVGLWDGQQEAGLGMGCKRIIVTRDRMQHYMHNYYVHFSCLLY